MSVSTFGPSVMMRSCYTGTRSVILVDEKDVEEMERSIWLFRKCLENGYKYTQTINISSNHYESKILDYRPIAGRGE